MDRERIAKQIVKMSNSICRKYCALKTNIVRWTKIARWSDTLNQSPSLSKQIIENTEDPIMPKMEPIENETFFSREEEYAELKPKRKKSNASFDNFIMASTPIKSMLRRSKIVPFTLNKTSKILQPRELSYEHPHALSIEDVFDTTNEPLVISIRHQLQTFNPRD